MKKLAAVLGVLGGLAGPCCGADAVAPFLTIKDGINPGTSRYLLGGLEAAEKEEAAYLVIQLDVPGGLVSSTRFLIKRMLETRVPIVVYIGPDGKAGSVAALLAFAADVVAMAPGAHLGGGPWGGGEALDEGLREKAVTDTAEFAETLARAKGRSGRWTVKALKSAEPLSAEMALKQGIADLVVTDAEDLRSKLSGFKLRGMRGGRTALTAESVVWRVQEPTYFQTIVSFFASPNLVYCFLVLGALLLWVELTYLGLIYPGVIGAVFLVLSLGLFQMLPVSYGALALLVVGMGLLATEVLMPVYGIFGLCGIVAYITGSLFLMDTTEPEFQVSLALILATGALLCAMAILIANLLAKARVTRPRYGLEAMVGELGEAREPVTEKTGKVFVQGELWNAVTTSSEPIAQGKFIVVKGIRGMFLVVEPQG